MEQYTLKFLKVQAEDFLDRRWPRTWDNSSPGLRDLVSDMMAGFAFETQYHVLEKLKKD